MSGAATDERRATAWTAVASWSVAMVLVGLVASVPRSPLQPLLARGAGPTGPFSWTSGALGFDRLSGSALVGASLVASIAATATFLWLLREAWRGRVSMRLVLTLAVIAQVAVLSLPLLVSRDVYSYIAYGRLESTYGLNPYVASPADIPRDTIVALVGPKWRSTPAVYGPAFTKLSAIMTGRTDDDAALVAAFRVLASLAAIGTAFAIAASVRTRAPERAGFAVAAFALNPVVVVASVGSGHNDLLVALTIAVALWLLLGGRTVLAAAALTVGALVKVTAGLPLLLLVIWVVASRPRGARARALASHVGVVVALLAVAAFPYLQTTDPTLGVAELAGHEGWLAPSRLIARALDAVSGDTAGVAARVVFALALVATVAVLATWLVRRTTGSGADRSRGFIPAPMLLDAGASWGWGLLLLMLLGPVLLPWYVTWVLPLAWLLPRVPRAVAIAVAAILGVSQWVAEPSRFGDAYGVNIAIGRYVLSPLVLALLVWLIVDVVRRSRAVDTLADPALAGPAIVSPSSGGSSPAPARTRAGRPSGTADLG